MIFEIGDFILISIFLFCGIGLFFTIRSIGETIKEGAIIRHDAAALVAGDLLPLEKKKQTARIRKRPGGLRLKLASLTIALVLIVNLIVSIPHSFMMTQRQTFIDRSWVNILIALVQARESVIFAGDLKKPGLVVARRFKKRRRETL